MAAHPMYMMQYQYDNRQHAHYAHLPSQQPMAFYPAVPMVPSTPTYSRPASACSQPAMQSMKQMTMTSYPSAMTPMASPQPMARRSNIVLETEACDWEGKRHQAHGIYYPSTPPLSSSGSAISSPESCDMLSTPMNPMFSGLDSIESIKPEVNSPESFPVLEWTSCASPPMTPGKQTLFLDPFHCAQILGNSKSVVSLRHCIASRIVCILGRSFGLGWQ